MATELSLPPTTSLSPTLPAENPTDQPIDDTTTALTTTTAPPPSTDPHTTQEVIITTNTEGKRIKKIIKKKRRPARPQVDPATFSTSNPPPQTGTVFNIWYNKWAGGDREDSASSQTPAKGRCSVKNDTGYTRADTQPGSSYFCLFFARGLCPRGRECEYLHRLPTSVYDLYSGQVDCFGRDKHSDYRDDMGGVGSFSRQNRTLYVGRIHATPDIEEVVARHFAEWGPVERIRVLPTRGVAFVTYRTEALAQFAKEAMAHQSLDNEEVLNVRWATVDPNPVSQKREARKVEEQAAEAIKRALPEAFVAELEGDPEAKRRRREEGGLGLEGYEAPDSVWYARGRVDALGGTERAGLPEGAGESKLLEEAVNKEEEVDETVMAGRRQEVEKEKQGGLFGASTLKALNGYSRSSQGPRETSSTAKSEGPLVDYGSDDE